jgi:hypothetical protein
MKTGKRLQLLYGVLVLATVITDVAGFAARLHWVSYIGRVLLGLTLESIVLPMAVLAFMNQSRLVSGRRLGLARVGLALILAAALGAIAYVQAISLLAAWRHYPH